MDIVTKLFGGLFIGAAAYIAVIIVAAMENLAMSGVLMARPVAWIAAFSISVTLLLHFGDQSSTEGEVTDQAESAESN